MQRLLTLCALLLIVAGQRTPTVPSFTSTSSQPPDLSTAPQRPEPPALIPHNLTHCLHAGKPPSLCAWFHAFNTSGCIDEETSRSTAFRCLDESRCLALYGVPACVGAFNYSLRLFNHSDCMLLVGHLNASIGSNLTFANGTGCEYLLVAEDMSAAGDESDANVTLSPPPPALPSFHPCYDALSGARVERLRDVARRAEAYTSHTVVAVDPHIGPVAGGVTVGVCGFGFSQTNEAVSHLRCRFTDGRYHVDVAAVHVDEHQLRCVAPDFTRFAVGMPHNVSVELSANRGGSWTRNHVHFTCACPRPHKRAAHARRERDTRRARTPAAHAAHVKCGMGPHPRRATPAFHRLPTSVVVTPTVRSTLQAARASARACSERVRLCARASVRLCVCADYSTRPSIDAFGMPMWGYEPTFLRPAWQVAFDTNEFGSKVDEMSPPAGHALNDGRPSPWDAPADPFHARGLSAAWQPVELDTGDRFLPAEDLVVRAAHSRLHGVEGSWGDRMSFLRAHSLVRDIYRQDVVSARAAYREVIEQTNNGVI
jgi:hypothetical protein